MKKRYSDEQIIKFLREAESGIKVKDLCRRHGFSEASFYAWRSKFGSATAEALFRLFGWKVYREKAGPKGSEIYFWKDLESWSRLPAVLEGKIESMEFTQPGAGDNGQWYKPEYL